MSQGTIPAWLRERVAAQAHRRCGYCLSMEVITGIPLEIDHIVPQAAGGTSSEENLWLACRRCNTFKGSRTHARDPVTGRRVRLFNPRRQQWKRHFAWSMDGTEIIGRTACGRATVHALRLNHEVIVAARRRWVSVGWHPPEH